MLAHGTLVLALAVACWSCRRDPQPPPNQTDHALLRDLEPPPLNRPIAQRPIPQQDTQPRLPPGPASALLVLRDGRPFTGTLNLTGRLALEADRIGIEPAAGAPFQILYRLPPGMPAPTPGTGDGTVDVTERSSPAGADRRVVARLAEGLALAEIWTRSPSPVVFDLGNGLRLMQRQVSASPDSAYREAPLSVVEGERQIGLVPIGRPTTVQTTRGPHVVFAEVSHLFTPPADAAGQVAGGYLLRAWVVPAR
jgi:hypothetical protein